MGWPIFDVLANQLLKWSSAFKPAPFSANRCPKSFFHFYRMAGLVGNVHVGKVIPILVGTASSQAPTPPAPTKGPRRLQLTPRIYNPATEEITQWLKHYNEVSKANTWADPERIDHLPLFTAGAAYQYISTRSTPYADWDEAKTDLQNVFGPKNSEDYFFDQMASRKQKEGEQCRVYFFDKLDRVHRWKPNADDGEKLSHLQRGLLKTFREKTYGRPFKTPNELLDRLVLIEEANKIASNADEDWGLNLSAKTEEVNNLKLVTSKEEQPMRCWSCGSDQHWKRACPDLKCAYCYKNGHNISSCWKKQNMEEGRDFRMGRSNGSAKSSFVRPPNKRN